MLAIIVAAACLPLSDEWEQIIYCPPCLARSLITHLFSIIIKSSSIIRYSSMGPRLIECLSRAHKSQIITGLTDWPG